MNDPERKTLDEEQKAGDGLAYIFWFAVMISPIIAIIVWLLSID